MRAQGNSITSTPSPGRESRECCPHSWVRLTRRPIVERGHMTQVKTKPVTSRPIRAKPDGSFQGWFLVSFCSKRTKGFPLTKNWSGIPIGNTLRMTKFPVRTDWNSLALADQAIAHVILQHYPILMPPSDIGRLRSVETFHHQDSNG